VLGIAGFTSEGIVKKIRLIAFAALAARSATKSLDYATVAQALKVEESEVESIAIDGQFPLAPHITSILRFP
jgi:translation initiation factor 3 subunit M